MRWWRRWIIGIFIFVTLAGSAMIGLHGWSFFVFRSAGTGQSPSDGGLTENQGPGQPDAPKPYVKPSPSSVPGITRRHPVTHALSPAQKAHQAHLRHLARKPPVVTQMPPPPVPKALTAQEKQALRNLEQKMRQQGVPVNGK